MDATGHTGASCGVIAVIILLISSIQAHKRAEAFALYSSGNSHIARGYLEPGAQLLEQALQHDAILVPIDAYLRMTTAANAEDKTVSVDLPADIPHFQADRNLIYRTLSNLLINAIKHTGRGGKITVRAREENEQLRIEVIDTGYGIPKDYKEKDLRKIRSN